MVKTLSDVLRLGVEPRVLSFDDAPFQSRPRIPGSEVHAVGIVTSGHRFEGMLYVGGLLQDGMNACERLAAITLSSKFHEQIHAVLLDGVTMGGLNVIDIKELANRLQRTVIAVMRKRPNMQKMVEAVSHLPDARERNERLMNAGPIFEAGRWVFQYACPADGVDTDAMPLTDDVVRLLDKCTPSDQQKVPEYVRHLYQSALQHGNNPCRC